jgi:hypothetical protein
MNQDEEQIYEGTEAEIFEQLSKDIPADAIERLRGKATSLTDKTPHTWKKCRRVTINCGIDPETGLQKKGALVQCTVIYDDGTSEVVTDEIGCD